MEELFALDGGNDWPANQVLYNLARRGIEFDLLPWCGRTTSADGLFAGRAGPARTCRTLAAIAARHEATPAQIALAWVLAQRRHRHPESVEGESCPREPRGARHGADPADLAELDRAFPPPIGRVSA